MSKPQRKPEAVFGRVKVLVNLTDGHCAVTAPRTGNMQHATRTMRLHSLDEIRGAYAIQYRLSAQCAVAADIARALRFAGEQLKSHQERKTR
jgi:hypothetical protein